MLPRLAPDTGRAGAQMMGAATIRAALVGLALIALRSAAPAQEPPVVKCEGPFGRNSTRADVIKAFGPNAVDQKVRRPEGERDKATVLYPKDAKRRLEIIWNDEKARRRPTIRITGESTWSTQNGVRLGLGLACGVRSQEKHASGTNAGIQARELLADFVRRQGWHPPADRGTEGCQTAGRPRS